MRARVEDLAALETPAARNVRLYLRMRGWQRSDNTSLLGPQVWSLPTSDGTYEVIAPSSKDARDYALRISELLRTISVVEDRSELDVLRDLNTLGFDVQYIHLDHRGPTGTAPLRDAAHAFNALHSA